MRLLSASIAPVILLFPSLGAGQAPIRQTQLDLMVSTFERSYITSTDVRGEQPPLLFEANVAPPFYIAAPSHRLAVVLTPKVVLRMFAETSAPVRTPSYMPRVTVYRFIGLNRPEVLAGRRLASYVSLTVSHHSNGQEGPVLNPDGTTNHLTGTFSTNFLEVAYATGLQHHVRAAVEALPGPQPIERALLGAFAHARYSVEVHGLYDSLSNVGYSHLRFHVANANTWRFGAVRAGACWSGIWSLDLGRCFSDAGLGYRLTYLAGDIEPRFQGSGRWPLWLEAFVTPRKSPDVSFFVNYYTGQDYYNSYFRHYLNTLRVGIQANRGTTGGQPTTPAVRQ